MSTVARTGAPSTEDIMRRVRDEVARRRLGHPASSKMAMHGGGTEPEFASVPTRVPPVSPPPLERRDAYRLSELLAYHDRDFVRQAYAAILRRAPDGEGERHYLEQLRSGELSKIEILGRLRYSAEGRSRRVRITGLMMPFAVHHAARLPVVGYPLALTLWLARLPRLAKALQRLESHTLRTDSAFVEQLNRQQDALDAKLDRNQVRHELDELVAETARGADAVRSLQAVVDGLQREVSSLSDALPTLTPLQLFENSMEQVVLRQRETASLADLHVLQVSLREAVDELRDSHASVAARLSEESSERSDLAARAERRIDSLQAQATAIADRLEGCLAVERAEMRRDTDTLRDQAFAARNEAAVAHIEAAAARSEAESLRHQLLDYRRTLLDTQRRVSMLIGEARKRMPAILDADQVRAIAAESDHVLDAFYASFEDRFRGTREDIKRRASHYLPLIRSAGAGTEEAPIIDLGCGRGEWLEVLSEGLLKASGVDLNVVMIEQCRERGLVVDEADALAYLRGMATGSVGAITAMHLIEHLPFGTLIELFDEVLRVLRPNGLLIFETPNPENLQVGACYFYLDPTHRNPLPPPLLEFIAEARGFVGVEVLRLSEGRGAQGRFDPIEGSMPGAASLNTMIDLMNNWMFSPPDYAIVARKA